MADRGSPIILGSVPPLDQDTVWTEEPFLETPSHRDASEQHWLDLAEMRRRPVPPPRPSDLVASQLRAGLPIPRPIDALTRREREVFELAVAGRMNRVIGETLSMSLKTVQTHRATINRKLGVHSTVELVLFAQRHGLLAASLVALEPLQG